MKLPRRRYWVPLSLLTAFAVGAWFQLHYHIIGVFRGDAYYGGMPTSYWRNALKYQFDGPPKWLGPVRPWLWSRAARIDPLPVFQGDPDSVPVVIQIMEDAATDPRIRAEAIDSLTRLRGPAPEELMDSLRKLSEGPLRIHAAQQLLKREADATLAVKTLLEFHVHQSKHKLPSSRFWAVSKIEHLAVCRKDIDPAPMLNVLHLLQGDSDGSVRQEATNAIERIGRAR